MRIQNGEMNFFEEKAMKRVRMRNRMMKNKKGSVVLILLQRETLIKK
jgi:hypothetical protein